jgi:hypothetical protein
MGINNFAFADMSRREEAISAQKNWIYERASELVMDGFHRDTARMRAIKEWEDGLDDDVDLFDDY